MDKEILKFVFRHTICGLTELGGLLCDKNTKRPYTGRKEGYRKPFLRKRIKISEINLENGEYHGDLNLWHDNGNKWIESSYVNGKRNGWRKTYDENGNLAISICYENDIEIKRENILGDDILNAFMHLAKSDLNDGLHLIKNKNKIKLLVDTRIKRLDNDGDESETKYEFIHTWKSNKDQIVDFIYNKLYS